jgi:hypothetical protein
MSHPLKTFFVDKSYYDYLCKSILERVLDVYKFTDVPLDVPFFFVVSRKYLVISL